MNKNNITFLFNHFFHTSTAHAGKVECTTGSIPARLIISQRTGLVVILVHNEPEI